MGSIRTLLLGGDGRSGWLERLALGLLVAGAILFPYGWIGHLVTPVAWTPRTALDRAVPFLPWTVWLYLPNYILILVVATSVLDRRPGFWRAAGAIALACAVAFAFFVAVPIAGPRPAAPGGDGLAEAAVRWVFRIDPPANTFPSLHIAVATLATLAARHRARAVGAALAVMTGAMSVSVLTTKQHHTADIFGGWALAWVAWVLVGRPREGSTRS